MAGAEIVQISRNVESKFGVIRFIQNIITLFFELVVVKMSSR